MKLTLRSLFLTVRRERMVFFLLVLCIASSAIVIHFAYGLYQNYHIILEEGESAAKELRVRIVKPETVTKKALHDCLVSVSDETNGDVIMYLAHPVIEPFQSKQTDWGTMTVRFTVAGAMIAPCEIYASNITQNGALSSGRYFDTQQEANGSRTALAGARTYRVECRLCYCIKLYGTQVAALTGNDFSEALAYHDYSSIVCEPYWVFTDANSGDEIRYLVNAQTGAFEIR